MLGWSYHLMNGRKPGIISVARGVRQGLRDGHRTRTVRDKVDK